MQDSNTKFLIFDIPFIINWVSQICTLKPGDVILTGTPGGVGMHRNPPKFLADGDTCVIEIEGLGRLSNPVKMEEWIKLALNLFEPAKNMLIYSVFDDSSFWLSISNSSLI